MDDGSDGFLMQIRELRARAARLTGNPYYTTVQELDALSENSAELSDEAMRMALAGIAGRLEQAAVPAEGPLVQTAMGTPEGPDIPPPPDSPAEPDLVPTPEIPEVPGSPAEPDYGPGPEIPPAPDSPAQPAMPGTPGTPGTPEYMRADAPEGAISDDAVMPPEAGAETTAGMPAVSPLNGHISPAHATTEAPFGVPAGMQLVADMASQPFAAASAEMAGVEPVAAADINAEDGEPIASEESAASVEPAGAFEPAADVPPSAEATASAQPDVGVTPAPDIPAGSDPHAADVSTPVEQTPIADFASAAEQIAAVPPVFPVAAMANGAALGMRSVSSPEVKPVAIPEPMPGEPAADEAASGPVEAAAQPQSGPADPAASDHPVASIEMRETGAVSVADEAANDPVEAAAQPQIAPAEAAASDHPVASIEMQETDDVSVAEDAASDPEAYPAPHGAADSSEAAPVGAEAAEIAAEPPTASADTVEAEAFPVATSEAWQPLVDEQLETQEPAEKTGFDTLADASWRRVQEVSGMEFTESGPAALKPVFASKPVHVSPPADAAPPLTIPDATAPAEPAVTGEADPIAPQAAEALSDGGSESRRSSAFPAQAAHPADAALQPAGEIADTIAAEADGAVEASSEAPGMNDAASLSESAAKEPLAAPADVLAVTAESAETTALGPVSPHTDSAGQQSPTLINAGARQEPLAALRPDSTAQDAAAASVTPSEADALPAGSAAQTVPMLAGADLAESPEQAETMIIAEVEMAATAAEEQVAKAAGEAAGSDPLPPSDPAQLKATRRGFFNRLFGGRESAHR